MNTITTLGEIRPTLTTGDPYADPFTVPLLRLRGHDRQAIQPDQCRVAGCLICAWRKAGLLDAPGTTIAREPVSGYACPTQWCPGCNSLNCICPPEGYEEALAEAAYVLGHDHGTSDGVVNRPTLDWLYNAGLDPESYLAGYDDACAGLPLGMPAEPCTSVPALVLYDEVDDGLPF